MRIKKMILNILDKNTGNLICAQQENDLSDSLLQDYLLKVIKKFQTTEGQQGELEEAHPFLIDGQQALTSFVSQAEKLAKKLFDIIAAAEEVPGGDVLFFVVENDAEEELFGVFKLNYSTKFTHFVETDPSGILNRIILNQAILPSPSQKLDEGILLNVTSRTYHLVEKKYKIEGERVHYFSNMFLNIVPKRRISEEIKTIKKVVHQISEKYNTEKFLAISNTQEAIYNHLDEEGIIDPIEIAEAAFQENISAKQEYLETIQQNGLGEKIPVANSQKYEKKYSKQKFKLDNGIELVIPVEVYKNKDMVEFVNNPNGTVSVIIKNIEEVMNKFN